MKRLLTLCFVLTGLFLQAQPGAGYQVGDIAKDFSLKNVDGKTVSLSDFKTAKGFIVIFTCNTCPVANAYEQRIIELNTKYSKLDYPVIAVNPNDPGAQPGDSFEKMQERATEKGYAFPYLLDPDHLVTKRFGATKTPHVFILQKTSAGNRVSYIGAIDNDTEGTNTGRTNYVEEAVNALATGQKPATSTTKAVGCAIKWKKS